MPNVSGRAVLPNDTTFVKPLEELLQALKNDDTEPPSSFSTIREAVIRFIYHKKYFNTKKTPFTLKSMNEVKTAFAKIKKYFADKGDATEGCINDIENGEGVDDGDDTKKTTENESTPSKQLFLMQMPSLTPLSSDDRQLGKSVLSPPLSPISSPFIESIGVSSQLPQAPLSSWESDERKERVFQLLESEIERYKEKLCDSEKKVASLTKELEKKTTELEEYKRLESKVSEGSCLLKSNYVHEIVKYVATIASINITDWAKEDYESIVKFFQIHSVHRDFSVDLTKYYSNHHLFKSDDDDKISGVGEISDDEELDKRNKRKKSASSSPSASETEVVAQFKTIKILRRDLERLQNFEYLNDIVLGISCTSFKHTDLVANKVFVPGCRDDYFFLFLFDLNFKKKSGTATLYDSLGRHHDDYLVHLQQFMNIFLTDFNIEFKSCKSCKRQQNGIDCGMYIISYMQYLSQKGCNDSEIATAPIMTRGELQALIGKYSVQ
ncbi:hypothetical protein C9374_008205 [Naegleria lovaniensis]|uniref:Ubiquitin-like protease family profile domain-containing protein n=1 Tax=Naegleria lovaniensis TaxID=51637 RepID=A0AA88KHU8_NAELO|nr:uncharacterized protein C9374_008205 [Naegleria lovaniensis]KAG2378566.1 hypothetical protein C9374_008205 [Naegleria lovaniensis]